MDPTLLGLLQLLALPGAVLGLGEVLSRLSRREHQRREAWLAGMAQRLELTPRPPRETPHGFVLEGRYRGTPIRVTALHSGPYEVTALMESAAPSSTSTSGAGVRVEGREVFMHFPPRIDGQGLHDAVAEVVKAAQSVGTESLARTDSPSAVPIEPALQRWALDEAARRRSRTLWWGAVPGVGLFLLSGALASGGALWGMSQVGLLALGSSALLGAVAVSRFFDRCPACRQRIQWRGGLGLFGSHCPDCGIRLTRDAAGEGPATRGVKLAAGVTHLRRRVPLPPSEVSRRLASAVGPAPTFGGLFAGFAPEGGFAGTVHESTFRLQVSEASGPRNLHSDIQGTLRPADGGTELEVFIRPAVPYGFALVSAALALGLPVFASGPLGTAVLPFSGMLLVIPSFLYVLARNNVVREARRLEALLSQVLRE